MKPCRLLLSVLVILGGPRSDAAAQSAAARATPPSSIPTVALANVARQGFWFAGGRYVGELGEAKEATMGGAMYVEVMVPKQIRSPYPIVFIHGAEGSGVAWLQTPDGRPGWAYNFLDMGYVVYTTDVPTRGRSQYVPGVDGNLNYRTTTTLETNFTASAALARFPGAKKHSQWPGTGRVGDPVFDQFAKSQVQYGGNERLTRDAYVALLDAINTPVILLTHSQGGTAGWLVADARPNLVRAIATVEPQAPPIRSVDNVRLVYNQTGGGGGGGMTWGVSNSPITYDPPIGDPKELQTMLEAQAPSADKVPCYVQQEPARQLKNLARIPVLFLSMDGSYHRSYDHCLAKWLNQAGVKTQYVEPESAGISGNSHVMMLEKNSADIAKYIGNWLSTNARPGRGENALRATPPKTIPTFSTDNLARKGVFYAGGQYALEGDRRVMRGPMYTEVLVPRQIRHPNPIVLFHGNGQTGVDWLQTPDGRAGWAYRLIDEGFVVYIVDYPARGRSPYVPLPGPDGKTPLDGNLGIRTALEIERIWTNARERGDFPLKMNHTQWPGSGKMGDPVFDFFMKTQVQFAGATGQLTLPAGIALLEMIGTPVIMFTHSQGGGFGFDITEARPHLVRAMITAEPGGPQFGNVDTAKVTTGPRNPNSWGLTNNPYQYDPPAKTPAEIEVVLEDKSERPDEARCWMQKEPARKLVRWQNIPVVAVSADGTYHRVYDPCIPRFLKQAGVKAEFVRLEDVGIRGNSHMMMSEKNSDEVIRWAIGWIRKNVPATVTSTR
jgi:pimeloyl-ACP methyl ester carboxylesterase